MPLEWEIIGLSGIDEQVRKLFDFLGERRKIVFRGEIGAGKTTIIQAFCRHLGVQQPVTSPTFSLANEYHYLDPDGQVRYVYHLDLYRLKRLEEALDIGIEEYLDNECYCLIEWPELIEEILPDDTVRINISIVDDSTRKMLIL